MTTRRRLLSIIMTSAVLFVLLAAGCLLPAALAPDGPSPTYTPPEKLYQRRPTLTAYKTTAPRPADLADLVAKYHVVSYHACPWNEPGTISLKIHNRGDTDAGPFNVLINDQLTRIEGIPAGETADALVPFKSGPVSEIWAEIDPEGMVAETDKDNNTFYILFTPPPPCAGTGTP